MRYVRWFILLILALLVISFACLNAQSVTINYLLGEHTISIPLLLSLMLLIGALLGFLVSALSLLHLKSNLWSVQKQLKLAQEELAHLRDSTVKNEL
jgi:lipopolysaccharide assembly protein A